MLRLDHVGVRRHSIDEAQRAVAGGAARLRSWTSGAKLPLTVVDGPGEVRSLTLATAGGELRIH